MESTSVADRASHSVGWEIPPARPGAPGRKVRRRRGEGEGRIRGRQVRLISCGVSSVRKHGNRTSMADTDHVHSWPLDVGRSSTRWLSWSSLSCVSCLGYRCPSPLPSWSSSSRRCTSGFSLDVVKWTKERHSFFIRVPASGHHGERQHPLRERCPQGPTNTQWTSINLTGITLLNNF